MKKLLTFSLSLLLCVGVRCKQHYKDSEGRDYVLEDSCLYGHEYTYTTLMPVGKVYITQWHKGWHCDSSVSVRNYTKVDTFKYKPLIH